MTEAVLVDTGPLVAFLSRRERHHAWAMEQFRTLRPPLLTCEAILSEACFLLRGENEGPDRVMQLLERDVIALSFSLAAERRSIASLLMRYRDVPMSLADACLVRMSERHDRAAVLTLDRDFHVYRKNGRQVIPTLMPTFG